MDRVPGSPDSRRAFPAWSTARTPTRSPQETPPASTTARQPLRVIVDSALRLPLTARLLAPPGDVLVATTSNDGERAARLAGAGAELLPCPAGADGRVNLPALLEALAARGMNELHVEAGATLSGAFLAARLADELLLYLAPALIGTGRPLAELAPSERMDEILRARFIDNAVVGTDIRLRARFADEADWLPAVTI